MADTLSTLQGDREHDLAGESAPKGVRLGAAIAGPDSFGMGLQVLVADWERSGRPPVDAIRRLHSQRLGKKVFPLVVALADAERSVWLMGPNPDASPVGPLPEPQAARILQASLDELSGLAARQRIAHLLRSLSSSDVVGVTNSGLFATYYLNSVLQDDTDWEAAGARAHDWLNLRDEPLIDALGFSARRAAANALVLTTDSARPRAVAVLLTDTEAFDADSPRFAVSPVAYGLSVAQREDAPWLIVLRGSQIRLYPARPGVGVGSRGQAETHFELDLAMVAGEHAAYLDLAFSATALRADGTIRQLLDGSTRYATSLGERLRQRVYEEAIPTLAVAVAHDLERLGHAASDDCSYAYRITLRILFRLLFQAYAEDRGLLPYGRNDRYSRNALKRWALDLVEQPDLQFDPHSHAIWDDLTQVWDVIDTGNTTWDVPAYNGGLFGTDPELHPAGAVIAAMQLNDAAVGHALRHLLVDDTVDGEVGAVDFRALSVREFGTIYEGLLESSLSRADQNLTLEKNAYLPAGDSGDVVVTAGEVYFHNASGERKATGSYFTPHFAVEHLLERALEPAIDQHLERIAQLLETEDQAGATEQFFDFRVADLAMGSGHFLVSAIDRIEAGMAAFLVDHELPGVTDELRRLEATAKANLGDAAPDFEIEPSALLRRQIARRCIYGLDINDIAVELARVAVWIHTFVPGLPMSTLDHNLVEANSLTGIGTITEAIEALDPSHKSGQLSIYSGPILDALEEAKKLLTTAANASEATKAEVRQSTEIHRKAREAAQPTKLLFDAAVATRSGIVDSLIGLDVDAIRQEANRPEVAEHVAELQPGHMPYLFPEVFLRTNPGFDVLIGNPPWEEAIIEENGFWTLHYPGLKRGMTAAKQEAEIIRLRTERADLHAEFKERQQVVERIRKALTAGPFPGMGTGDPDYYKAFVWRFWNLARERGRAGVVLPRSVFTAAGSKEWRTLVLSEGCFDEVTVLYNRKGWVFDDLHHADYVALVAVDKHGQSDTMPYRGPFDSLEAFNAGVQLEPARFIVEEYLTWTENASLPLLPSPEAIDVFLKLRAHPRLDQDGDWTVRPYRELDATNDKLSKGGVVDVTSPGRPGEWPVYKGESFNLWEPEVGAFYGWAESGAALERLQSKRLRGNRNPRSVYSEFDRSEIGDVATLEALRPRIAFRDGTHATNSRTVLAALIPPKVFAANQAPVLVWPRGDERDEAYLLGVLSSIPLDWYARKLVKTHVNFHLFRAFPVPRPGRDSALRREVEISAGRLAAIDDRYADWAKAVGVEVASVESGDAESDLIAGLDAAVSHLYGLEEHDVVHIFETFHRGWDHTERLTAVLAHYRASRARAS